MERLSPRRTWHPDADGDPTGPEPGRSTSDKLVSGRRFCILTVVDDFTRECLGLVADTSLAALRVMHELDHHRSPGMAAG